MIIQLWMFLCYASTTPLKHVFYLPHFHRHCSIATTGSNSVRKLFKAEWQCLLMTKPLHFFMASINLAMEFSTYSWILVFLLPPNHACFPLAIRFVCGASLSRPHQTDSDPINKPLKHNETKRLKKKKKKCKLVIFKDKSSHLYLNICIQ